MFFNHAFNAFQNACITYGKNMLNVWCSIHAFKVVAHSAVWSVRWQKYAFTVIVLWTKSIDRVSFGCFTSQSTMFQSYMWRHIDLQSTWRSTLQQRSGSQRLRHFLRFLNIAVLHRHGTNLFTVIPRKRPILVAFYDAHWETEDPDRSNL